MASESGSSICTLTESFRDDGNYDILVINTNYLVTCNNLVDEFRGSPKLSHALAFDSETTTATVYRSLYWRKSLYPLSCQCPSQLVNHHRVLGCCHSHWNLTSRVFIRQAIAIHSFTSGSLVKANICTEILHKFFKQWNHTFVAARKTLMSHILSTRMNSIYMIVSWGCVCINTPQPQKNYGSKHICICTHGSKHPYTFPFPWWLRDLIPTKELANVWFKFSLPVSLD